SSSSLIRQQRPQPSQRASHSAGDISSSVFSSQKAILTVTRSLCCRFALVCRLAQSYSGEEIALSRRKGQKSVIGALGFGVQDPFYTKEKRKKPAGGMLAADAWLDSSLYEFWQTL